MFFGEWDAVDAPLFAMFLVLFVFIGMSHVSFTIISLIVPEKSFSHT